MQVENCLISFSMKFIAFVNKRLLAVGCQYSRMSVCLGARFRVVSAERLYVLPDVTSRAFVAAGMHSLYLAALKVLGWFLPLMISMAWRLSYSWCMT